MMIKPSASQRPFSRQSLKTSQAQQPTGILGSLFLSPSPCKKAKSSHSGLAQDQWRAYFNWVEAKLSFRAVWAVYSL